jgi:hypothetical protein
MSFTRVCDPHADCIACASIPGPGVDSVALWSAKRDMRRFFRRYGRVTRPAFMQRVWIPE